MPRHPEKRRKMIKLLGTGLARGAAEAALARESRLESIFDDSPKSDKSLQKLSDDEIKSAMGMSKKRSRKK